MTFDATPSFAGAKAIMCRVVTINYNIIELLARCNIYEKKRNSIETKAHLKDAVLNQIEKKLRGWMSVQSDHASTNKVAMRNMKEEEENAAPRQVLCVFFCPDLRGYVLIDPF